VPDPIVVARDVSVTLAGVPVLAEVDLTVAAREVVAVLGANGAGKSTLLRCIAGLQQASGRMEVLGRPPVDEPDFWRDVVLVGDEPTWYPGLTVEEHLELLRMVHGPGRLDVRAALKRCELSVCIDRSPLSLSTGQRQRLSLAMGLLRPSRLLLLDEPERGLDADFRARLAELLAEYLADGGAVVMATHDPRLAAGTRHLYLQAAA
jgi:ABC-2 type transport system ATP-binding protein